MMKKILLIIFALLSVWSAEAQYTFHDAANKDMLRVTRHANNDTRREVVIPKVNGYNVYKADLHTHTTASDGRSSLKDMIEINYGYGFDIYATSDHGLTS